MILEPVLVRVLLGLGGGTNLGGGLGHEDEERLFRRLGPVPAEEVLLDACQTPI